MGLRVQIYRDGPANRNSLFRERSAVVLVNVDGPAEPRDDEWAAILTQTRNDGPPIIIPDMEWMHANGYWESVPSRESFAHGGAFAFASDSRFARALEGMGVQGGYCAVPIHDHSFTLEDIHWRTRS